MSDTGDWQTIQPTRARSAMPARDWTSVLGTAGLGFCCRLRRSLEQREQPLQQHRRRWWAAFDVQVDGDDVFDSAGNRIRGGEHAAVEGAIADGDNPFGIGR